MNTMTTTETIEMVDEGGISDTSSDFDSRPSSPDGEDNLLNEAMENEVTAQLVNAGVVGIAAAAAITSSKKRKRPHSFETNPSIRKRQQNRLLRKLRVIMSAVKHRLNVYSIYFVYSKQYLSTQLVWGNRQ